jgi:glutamyl-Q tRNA(Asp) synthetase
MPGIDRHILMQLTACGFTSDDAPVWQSSQNNRYQSVLNDLVQQGLAYPCACSRQDVAAAQAQLGNSRERNQLLPYPGTCRPENGGLRGREPRAWRLHTGKPFRIELGIQAYEQLYWHAGQWQVYWRDRRLGQQQQNVTSEVGDFVLRRADGFWAYQLAVVADDAAQGVTHVVRGADLTDNTARQILLGCALKYPTITYLHTPLVLGANGEKLSKQNGAPALRLTDESAVIEALNCAAQTLQLPVTKSSRVTDALAYWIPAWANMWGLC